MATQMLKRRETRRKKKALFQRFDMYLKTQMKLDSLAYNLHSFSLNLALLICKN